MDSSFFFNLAGFVQHGTREEGWVVESVICIPRSHFYCSALPSRTPFIPHAPDMLRFPLSISSPLLSHLLPPHLSFWFPFYDHLLLYYPPFIHSLSVSLSFCCCKFSSPLVTANAIPTLCFFPLYLSPPLVQPRLIRWHCYGAPNK